VFETQSYYPQFVPKSNRDQQKKNPQKELFPPSSLFLLKKLRWFGRNPRRRCRGGLGKIPGGGAEVVWAKPQAEVQMWWPTNKVAEGFGSGRLDFGDGFCWRKKWFIEKNSF
jgi:hypothetical protein